MPGSGQMANGRLALKITSARFSVSSCPGPRTQSERDSGPTAHSPSSRTNKFAKILRIVFVFQVERPSRSVLQLRQVPFLGARQGDARTVGLLSPLRRGSHLRLPRKPSRLFINGRSGERTWFNVLSFLVLTSWQPFKARGPRVAVGNEAARS